MSKAARAFLECPEPNQLAFETLSLSRNDGRADPFRWASLEVVGCQRSTWCSDEDLPRCGRAPDFEAIAGQLNVESGCPIDSLRVVARAATYQPREGRRAQGADGASTLRVNACGQHFVCTVPLSTEDTSDTPLPAMAGELRPNCHPAATPAAAAPPPAP